MKHQGMSLIELLIVIAIVAILISSATPSLSPFIEHQRSDATIADIYRFYQAGRDLSVRKRERIYMCGSNDQQTCSKYWSKNLILFHDKNGDKAPSASEIVHIKQLSLGNSYIWSRMAFGKNYFFFEPNGQTSWTGSMVFCPESQKAQHYNRVTWNRVGRPYRGTDKNKDGVIEDTNGKALSCS